MIPAVLIAGTHSGVGKTTVVLGLMAALRRRGLAVQPFKVGPDFIDPSHHTAICGRPSRNLDTFMMGIDGVKRSFNRGIAGADVAVVEGVMGLYDGLDATEEASTAQVAKALDIPVLLVINVHGMSRSAGAMELGYANFDPDVRLAGTILNRVGSERHLSILQDSLKLPIFGALPRSPQVELKSRHLGLQMGFEIEHDLEALVSLVEEHVDIERASSIWPMNHAAPLFSSKKGQEIISKKTYGVDLNRMSINFCPNAFAESNQKQIWIIKLFSFSTFSDYFNKKMVFGINCLNRELFRQEHSQGESLGDWI